jgi:transcriptional regulator with XRE-family HTH domain
MDSEEPGDPLSPGAMAPATAEAIVVLLKRRGLTQQQLEARAGLRRGQLSRMLRGTRPLRPAQLEALAAALGADPGALLTGSAVPVDATGRLPAGSGTLGARGGPVAAGNGTAADRREPLETDAKRGIAAGPGVVLSPGGEARLYPGYWLWRRDDPRDAGSAAAAALSPGRRVLDEGGDVDAARSVFVVRVDDPGALVIDTAQGRVASGWRIFVDRDGARAAAAGATVAAMTLRGELAVGELGRCADGGWYLDTGRSREPVDRADVLGTVLKYSAPPVFYGRVAAGGGDEPPGGADAPDVA